MSYIRFDELPNEGFKTKIWEVIAVTDEEPLGKIKFRGAWRKFVFEPRPSTSFDADCLREIAAFTITETQRWKEEKVGS